MDKQNVSFEPMDVDLSVHSNNDMDASFNDSKEGIDAFIKKINNRIKSSPISDREDTFENPPLHSPSITPFVNNIKKIHINMQKNTVSTHNATKVKVACAVLVLFLSVIAYQLLNIQCFDDLNLNQLKESLSNKLYGQTRAIDALIEGLVMNESKILIMFGSTGVGKTLAASILLECLGPHSNVYHYTMPSFMETFTTDFMIGFTVCKKSIVIVDNLSPNDIDVKDHISNLITKSEHFDKVVTVILIYNHCNTANDFRRQCDEKFPSKVLDNLKQVKAHKKIIQFEALTDEHLQKCILTELGQRRITYNELTMISKNFDVAVDGCKGVHTKMKLLDIS